MKVHVFVATTQGLVAIQRIYAQNPDIRSVVSINGTATVSPISAAYYHFVKKGVGIIENDFGGSAYRVNIDGQIDQGSSWQLGFYLAHAAHAQNILGDGKPRPGDKVICATGEINTSERVVLAVDQIPLKIQRASSQIKSWSKNLEVHFSLPKGNANESFEESDIHSRLVWIDTLEDALKLLAVNDESTLRSNIEDDVLIVSADNDLFYKPFLKQQKNRWLLLGIALLLATGWYFYSGSPVHQSATPTIQSSTSKSLPETQLSNSHDTLVSIANVEVLTVLHTDDLLAKQQVHNQAKATLKLGYADEEKCQGAELEYRELRSVEGKFKPAPYPYLCEIHFEGDQSYSTLFAINQVSHRFVRAEISNQSFAIPVPGEAAEYLLLAFKNPVNTEHYRQLHGFLFNLDEESILSANELGQLSQLADLEYAIFSHQLTVK